MSKNLLFSLLFLLPMLFSAPANAQKTERLGHSPEIVCPYDHQNVKAYVPAPAAFLEAAKNGRTEGTSKINVTYIGFSDEAQTAFQHAVDIWESLLVSPVEINVQATWKELPEGVLGAAGAGDYFLNFDGAPLPDTWYPVALAEKLAGKELNKTAEADITATFSNAAEWYYGTDGETTAGNYDLVTVVLHELGHGLGFASLTSIDTLSNGTTVGSWGHNSKLAGAFDFRIVGDNDEKMIDKVNGSAEVKGMFTTNKLFFISELAEKTHERIKLYAPSDYSAGSSVSHVDATRYRSGQVNSLMRPSVSAQTAIHNPGNLMLAMFSDMGWVWTKMTHEKLTDNESLPDSIAIRARFKSDTILFASTAQLHYSFDGFKTDNILNMSAVADSADQFLAHIPTGGENREVDYYFTVRDTLRTYTYPNTVPKAYYNFQTGPDKVAPEIEHQSPENIFFNDPSIEFSAKVSDRFGVKSVRIERFVNDEKVDDLEMKSEAGDGIYTGSWPLVSGLLKTGDVIKYRIIATDSSAAQNQGFSPAAGFHEIKVEGFGEAVDSYGTTFNTGSEDFIFNGFRIEQPAGFEDKALHSDHPYAPAGDGKELNLTVQLKKPIRIKDGRALMQFDEIVLVEPGESGATWGGDEFWDYVVVEGSTDFGISWQAIGKGYDCNYHFEWADLYNGTIVDQNSQGVGQAGNFKTRIIRLSDTFRAGEVVLIRFRLFSDPFASGWGWAIDNLEIQTEAAAAEQEIALNSEFRLYPNPVSGVLSVSADFEKALQNGRLRIRNLLGQTVYEEKVAGSPAVLNRKIETGTFRPGVYFLEISGETGRLSRKFLVK